MKYRDKERVFLQGFDDAAIRCLSDEFGLVLLTEQGFDPSQRVREDYFLTSAAWQGLREWVARHPRLARASAHRDHYVRGWHQRAVAELQAMVG